MSPIFFLSIIVSSVAGDSLLLGMKQVKAFRTLDDLDLLLFSFDGPGASNVVALRPSRVAVAPLLLFFFLFSFFSFLSSWRRDEISDMAE